MWLKVGYQVCQPCVSVESQLWLGSHLLHKAELVVIIFGCGGKGECLTEIPVQVLLFTASKCYSEVLGLCCPSCSDLCLLTCFAPLILARVLFTTFLYQFFLKCRFQFGWYVVSTVKEVILNMLFQKDCQFSQHSVLKEIAVTTLYSQFLCAQKFLPLWRVIQAWWKGWPGILLESTLPLRLMIEV